MQKSIVWILFLAIKCEVEGWKEIQKRRETEVKQRLLTTCGPTSIPPWSFFTLDFPVGWGVPEVVLNFSLCIRFFKQRN